MTWRASRAPSSPLRASRSCPTRWPRAPVPAARSRSRAGRARDGGQGGLQPRPARSATATSGGHPSGSTPIKSRDARDADCHHPLPQHLFARARRPVDTVSIRRASCSQACSPSQMANVRTYEITNSGVAAERNCRAAALLPSRPASRASRRRIRAACSSPATRCPVAPATSERLGQPEPARNQQAPRPTSVNNTAATLEEVLEHYKAVLPARGRSRPRPQPLLTTQPGVAPPVHRPSVHRRRGSRAAGIPAQDLIGCRGMTRSLTHAVAAGRC